MHHHHHEGAHRYIYVVTLSLSGGFKNMKF
uniref:Uncharacterized protein n=1 Tax=Aegilops tauschii subsp. strangulata TaxID=200361 RepID=A0A453T2L1_AEGTS